VGSYAEPMSQRRVVAAWGGFGIVAVVSAALIWLRPPAQRLSDLHIYYGAAQAVNDGRPLYDYVAENGGPFTYPPFAVLLFRPLALLPEGALQVLWLAVTCAAVAVLAVAVGRGLSASRLAVAAMACALLVSAPVQSNLRFGQVSIFVVLLALVDAMGMIPRRYTGILVGLAAAIKLTPLLFVVYFLLARRYKDAARAAGAFAACALLGAALLPEDSWRYWTGTMLQTSRIGNLASLGNQSVQGMLMRAGLSPGALPLVWAALIAAVCAVALWRARVLDAHGERVRAAVLVGCATVAASPVSWTHHQVWTVLAAMLLVATHGVWHRAAGVVLLVVMTLSLGVVLRGVSTYPGWQFLLENARALGVVAVCLGGVAGLGGVVVTARRRAWLRPVVAVAAGLAVLALTPLPAGADPTFKAYTAADLTNPRYFYYDPARGPRPGEPVAFQVRREKTKVRVNGVVDPGVAQLRYHSAPGGAGREIPLLLPATGPGLRTFSFRSATLASGRLDVLDAAGTVVTSFTGLEDVI
jgi:alpha-1,2-mannosyltransferase